jgi:hypothetical protein
VVNTRNILFIVSGAFSGLEKIIEKRQSKASIGFGAAMAEKPAADELFTQARTQDFMEYGFEAEFIGRLPVRVFCEALTADDLFQIMKHSEGSLIRQYEREFHAYGVRATFKDEALRAVAVTAAEEKTGARGLVTDWEKELRDFKFELPSLGLPELIVDGDLVKDTAKALECCRIQALTQPATRNQPEVPDFATQFAAAHGITLVFKEEAILALKESAQREGCAVDTLCTRLFKDFPFGLPLVSRSTGQTIFDADQGKRGTTRSVSQPTRSQLPSPTRTPFYLRHLWIVIAPRPFSSSAFSSAFLCWPCITLASFLKQPSGLQSACRAT